jgi:hypothetical protein
MSGANHLLHPNGNVGARQLEMGLLLQTEVSPSCLAPTDRLIKKLWFHANFSIAVCRRSPFCQTSEVFKGDLDAKLTR